ncbi:MAG: O-antigen ligase family protein [Vicinamibacterales bacterium]|nr:O-antigen ligase family protein [Vicinamibacterales bacterium]
MSVLTRAFVNLSTVAAAGLLAWQASAGFRPLFTAATVVFLAALAAGVVWRGLASRALLFVIYLSPAGFLVWTGRNHFSFEVVWIAGLLGLMLSGRDAWRWHLPSPWRWPLVLWALVVAASWPVVAGRELDFAPWIIDLPRVANTSIGIGPGEVLIWTLYVVLTHNIGLLWFDWLYRCYAHDASPQLRREVLWPLAAAVVVACVVGVYQALVDIRFLSGHLWPHMERAAGTLMDANAFGMIAALWGPALVALVLPGGGTRAVVTAALALGLSVLGVWASGSRTALVAVIAGLVAVAIHAWRAWREADAHAPLASRRHLVVAGVVAGVAVAAVAVMFQTPGITAFERARHLIPGLETTVGHSLWLLWDRMGYGAAALLMIQEHPWIGVGVGGYHTLVHDFARAAGGYDLPPDNAQHWLRHHVAELGVLGALPIVAWTLLFLRALVTPSRTASAAPGLLRGALVALGLISLVGMPGQAAAVVITFWTFAFWYLHDSGLDESRPVTPWPAARTRVVWALAIGLVAVHAAATYVEARGSLRPAERAVRFGWDYRYGVYDIERPPEGAPYRWTMTRGLMVVPVAGSVLRFEAWIDHPDADAHPVAVRVWAGDALVASATLRRGERVTADIRAPAGRSRIILRTEVDRAWRPMDHGGTDPRELGLAIADWHWVR